MDHGMVHDLEIWNLEISMCVGILTGHKGPVMSLQLLPNNKLASGSLDGTILIWNLETSQRVGNLTGHKYIVTSLQLLTNNKLASGSESEIKIWDVDTGECIRTHEYYRVKSLQFLTNNKLASVSDYIWFNYNMGC